MSIKACSKNQILCDNNACKQEKVCELISRYTTLTDKACEAIFSLSPRREVLYANHAARVQFQLPIKKKLKGIFFDSLVSSSCINKVNNVIKDICSKEDVGLVEFNAKGLKGVHFPAEMIASPSCEEGDVCEIYVLVRNISNRRDYEELVKESERRKVMQEVLVGTSQEIVNPLKVLLNSSDGLMDKYSTRDFEYIGYKDFKEIFRTIDTIRTQVKQSLRITNNLISLNKRKHGLKDESCSVNKAIQSVIDASLLHIEDDSIKMTLDLGQRIPHVAVDIIEFKQVVENVFLNAAQSVRNKGRITLKTRFIKKENVVRIDCKDNGVGIPQDILERIFEPFFSTKQQGSEKSSGLGLTIVHGLVRAYKGDIVIKSDLQKGTLVSIFFPTVKSKC